MSTMRKVLKVLSLIAIVGGIDLVITDFAMQGSLPAPELLQTVIVGISALLTLVLGGRGIGAANRPTRAKGLLPIALVALLVDAASVVLALQSGLALVTAIIVALTTVGYAYAARAVWRESLSSLS